MEQKNTYEKQLNSFDDENIKNRINIIYIKKNKEGAVLLDEYFGTPDAHIPMSQRFIVDSESFFLILQALAQNSKESKNKSRYYFRGESTSEYDLLPSLLRDSVYESLNEIHGTRNYIELQKKLLDRFRRYTQHIIHADNDFKAPISKDFDTLCLAQHYGLPTLLMDWTLNPYVAAYFAVSNAYRRVLHEKLGANKGLEKYYIRVWIMKLKNPDERKKYTVHLEDIKTKWENMLGNAQTQPAAPLIVVPLVFTRRIAAQAGRFVYCGYMSSAENLMDKDDSGKLRKKSLAYYSAECDGRPNKDVLSWEQLFSLDVEFDISLNIKDFGRDKFNKLKKAEQENEKLKFFNLALMKMIRELDFIGFNAGRLFPDLEGWAKYLREGNL